MPDRCLVVTVVKWGARGVGELDGAGARATPKFTKSNSRGCDTG